MAVDLAQFDFFMFSWKGKNYRGILEAKQYETNHNLCLRLLEVREKAPYEYDPVEPYYYEHFTTLSTNTMHALAPGAFVGKFWDGMEPLMEQLISEGFFVEANPPRMFEMGGHGMMPGLQLTDRGRAYLINRPRESRIIAKLRLEWEQSWISSNASGNGMSCQLMEDGFVDFVDDILHALHHEEQDGR
jgi:hypothetical protein